MNNLGASLNSTSDNEALIDLSLPDQPRSFSFVGLQRMANGVASNLDIQRGARVGILGENSAEFVATFLGIMRAGGVAVPINFKFPEDTINYIVRDASISLLFADQANQSRINEPIEVRPLNSVQADRFPIVNPLADEPALVLYTSGSTGQPKGVVLSHNSQMSMVQGMGPRMKDQCSIVAAPLYHMNAMLTTFALLLGQGKVVLLPRFRARTYLQALDTYKVNIITGIPTMLAMMLREKDLIQNLDFDSVTAITIGSAPLSETVAKEVKALFPNAGLSNGYGTTEAGAGIFGPHPDRLAVPLVSLGFPQPHVEVRLVGNDPTEGVLEVKTPAAMNGYLNLPEKTKEKTTGDGWINTGDVMRVDENGFYYFVGRDDDMFNCGGENIYPGQLERLLEKDDRISECSVVALADKVRGQVPVAFVVKAAEHEIEEQTVKDIVLADMPAYMHPRHVVFISEMPIAGTNKIDRKRLEQQAAEQIKRD